MKVALSVWYTGQDPKLYPMVMVERGINRRYHYHATRASIERLISFWYQKGNTLTIPHYNGWTIEYQEKPL